MTVITAEIKDLSGNPAVWPTIKFTLQGYASTPINVANGEPAPAEYTITGSPTNAGTLTGEVLGNDQIWVNGFTTTYYTIETFFDQAYTLSYEADYDITGSTWDLGTAVPITNPPPAIVVTPPDWLTNAYVSISEPKEPGQPTQATLVGNIPESFVIGLEADLAAIRASISSGGAIGFTFTQSSPSTSWTITHGLGRYPQVTIIDNTGHDVYADIQNNTINQCVITFSTALAGIATLL